MPDQHPAAQPPHADVVGLLTGELTPSLRTGALAHVRGCEPCRDELVVVAAALGELRDADRHAPVDPSEVPPLRLDRSSEPTAPGRPGLPPLAPVGSGSAATPADRRTTRRRTARAAGLLVAAVLLVLAGAGVGLGVGLGLDGTDDPSAPVPAAAPVTMAALVGAPAHAAGSATMAGHDEGRTMQVALVGLPPPATGTHYTVWLIDTRHHRALSVGVMPASTAPVMRAVFALPEAEVAGYDALDVSQESDSFATVSPVHSLLRGSLV